MGRGAAHQIADQVRSTEYVPYRYFILPSLIHFHYATRHPNTRVNIRRKTI